MSIDPRISLAIDNCFASKRWTRPVDWMSLIRDMGLTLVEASADTECDPLYMGDEYTADWISEVKKQSEKLGVKVANLYSGHGTYATLGLVHTDERVRLRFRDKWFKKQADTARQLDAGLGFFAHGIHEPALQNPEEYQNDLNILFSELAELAAHAKIIGLSSMGIEQMYSPHQPPWTIQGAKTLLKTVKQKASAPFYLTLDVGHMNGQQYFQKPSTEQIETWIECKATAKPCKRVWVGPRKAMDIFNQAVNGSISKKQAIEQIQEQWEGYDYLFASPEDGIVHAWLRELAGYSPIIHLQQSDGKSSPHWPFSPEYNRNGIIHAGEVLQSIAQSYEKEDQDGFPPQYPEIMLTLEPFISTAGNIYDAVEEIEKSILYWRQYIPRDGMRLSEILSVLPDGKHSGH